MQHAILPQQKRLGQRFSACCLARIIQGIHVFLTPLCQGGDGAVTAVVGSYAFRRAGGCSTLCGALQPSMRLNPLRILPLCVATAAAKTSARPFNSVGNAAVIGNQIGDWSLLRRWLKSSNRPSSKPWWLGSRITPVPSELESQDLSAIASVA